MFKLFKKKNKETKSNEHLSLISAEDIIQGIKAVQKRTKKDIHYICYLNAYMTSKSRMKLRWKGYIIKDLIYKNSPGFKVYWK